jgi:signal transduction histidine kinase
MMPGMDGFEVCKRMRQDKQSHDMPILFLTAKTGSDMKVKAFECGGSDYIVKPFDPEEVMARAKTHLDLRRTTRELACFNMRLTEMLETRTKELIHSEKLAAFSLLTAGIVHNLRSPLSGVMGAAQAVNQAVRVLSLPDDLNAESYSEQLGNITRYSNMIQDACQSMNNMLNSLLIRGSMDNDYTPEVKDLNTLIANELEFLQADLYFKSRINKVMKLWEVSLPVVVVPSEITQVINNLIRNAIDALHDVKDAVLKVETGKDENGTAWFSVSDNGYGIAEELHESIFDPFFTTKPHIDDSSVSGDVPRGTGLGLYMCRRIIESYGGTIDLKSKEGGPTTFTVKLP